MFLCVKASRSARVILTGLTLFNGRSSMIREELQRQKASHAMIICLITGGLISVSGIPLLKTHQPFFLSGVLSVIALMLMFALSYKGVVGLSVSVGACHAYGVIFLTFTQFFIGFLFTTFPRGCQSKPIGRAIYIGIFLFCQVGLSLFIIGSLFSETVDITGVLVTHIGHI